MAAQVAGVAGILLTGGESRRMGTDKAALRIEGVPAAARLGARLARVAAPVIEVGPGHSGLPAAVEPHPGRGPLPAVAAGWARLSAAGHDGPAILLACDLPLVDEALLRLIAGWPGAASVVPVVDGHPQVLCARLSPTALRAADTLAGEGHRSLRALLAATPVTWLHPADWEEVASPTTFVDTDRPEDLDALGMTWRPP